MMEKFATENLILLEFLVEAVNFDYSERNDLQVMNGETLVSFQFLDNAPLLVTEEEFGPKSKEMCPIEPTNNVKHGKSCLFSLTPMQAENALIKFDIFVEIYKRMKPGMLPEKIKIGESLISIVNIFTELMDAIIKRQETTSAKIMMDTFKIMNLDGQSIGRIKVFVRISCFGKLIVTQFQMNLESKSVEFKAKEGHYMFKYDKKDGRCPNECCPNDRDRNVSSDSSTMCRPATPVCCNVPSPSSPPQSCYPPPGCCPKPPCPPPGYCPMPPCPPPGYCPTPPCPPPGCCPTPRCPPPGCCPPSTCCPTPPCSPRKLCCLAPPSCPYLLSCSAPPSSPNPPNSPRRQISAPTQNTCCMTPCEIYQMQMAAAQSQPQPPPCGEGASLPYSCDDKFQEIGASMGKNAVTIRVRKQFNAKVEPWNGECMQEEEEEESEEEEVVCTCNSKTKKRSKSTSSASRSANFKKIPRSCSLPRCCNSASCPTTTCPPPTCCLPPPCSPQIEQAGEAPTRRLTYPQCPPTPACCYSPPCYPTCPTGNPLIQKKCDDDPEKETFILKIGKKNEREYCKQNDLELEVCTPKGKEIKPPPQKQSRDTQYTLVDIPDEYLEAFYGKDKWKKMKKQQAEEEAKLRKMYGAYGFGEDVGDDEGKKKKGKGKGKGGKGDGNDKARCGGGAGVFIEREVYVCDPCNPCRPCRPAIVCPSYNPCDPCATVSTCCYR